jgi:D-alanyl-D-alanine carboxypeptidase (penicillin-binding protein 5/6)
MLPAASPEASAVPPVLPADGATAITEGADLAPLAVAGETAAVPMAGITKTITALVVLDAKPLADGEPGGIVPITTDDYLSYLDYRDGGTRTVTVYTADEWTERGMLQALLLGSSNNHADTLARWAFGSVDAYVEAANAWLDENGMTGTTVVDATGLDEKSVGTATDLARLAALALNDSAVSSVLSEPVTGLPSRRGITNTTTYLPEQQVVGVSRSYTDAAGICLLFAGDVSVEGESYRFYGAFLRQPDWETLERGVTAVMESARAGVTPTPVLAEGSPVVTFTTPWGESADGVSGASPARLRWGAATPEIDVQADDVSSAGTGAKVGSITVVDGSVSAKTSLTLNRALTDPGVFWRLSHPVPVIGSLIDSLSN